MSEQTQNTTATFRAALKAARRAATPLIMIRSADPASAIAHVTATLNGKAETTPLLTLDVCGGLGHRNDAGQAAMSAILNNGAENISSVSEGLQLLTKVEEYSIIFFFNPHRLWDNAPDIIQAIWNLRDIFKLGGQQLILLTTLGATLPAELSNDVTVLDEPLPNVDELKTIIKNTFTGWNEQCNADSKLKLPDAAQESKIIDALIGLASFPAEQVLSMSISKSGIDLDRLWERKRQAINQVRGLKIWRGGETFDDVGGCDNVKTFLRKVLSGKDAPRVIVFIDEIEKAFAGTGTDMSGVKTELTGTILSHMEDTSADGIIFIGPPGAAKTAISKASGADANIPTIACDFSGMQSGIVGSSGENLRTALQVIDAISQGKSLWLATCNSISSLPPELRRRFGLGSFFFDLPDASERKTIWDIYRKKWSLTSPIPKDEGWTGAEIKGCCNKAYRLGITLEEAGKYVVPVSVSASDQIATLRRQSSGKFISASKPGIYMHSEAASAQSQPKSIGRKINTEA